MSREEQSFGLFQAKLAVLDAISCEGVSDANKESLNSTLSLLRRLETLVLSDESAAVRLANLLGLLGMKSSKRGVHYQRDELLVELVVFMTLERGLEKPDARLFQQAGHHIGVSHERSVEKIWADMDGPVRLASYRAQAEGNKQHWTLDKTKIRKQTTLIISLLAEVSPKS